MDRGTNAASVSTDALGRWNPVRHETINKKLNANEEPFKITILSGDADSDGHDPGVDATWRRDEAERRHADHRVLQRH